MTASLSLLQLQKMWPYGDRTVPGLMAGIAGSAPSVFAKYGVTSQLVVAIMFGQFSEETGEGRDMIEDIRYSPARAVQLWPSHFRSVADVYAKIGSYVGDSQFDIKLMDYVYGGRMGNRPGTHDGSTYIGHGLTQATGLDGFLAVKKRTGLDVVSHPEIFIAPATLPSASTKPPCGARSLAYDPRLRVGGLLRREL